MILLDANLLVYAHVNAFPQHDRARSWLDEQLNGVSPVGIPWPSLLAFVRLTTNPRVFEKPLSVEDAWRQGEAWLDCPPVWIPTPTENHRQVLGRLLKAPGVRGNLIPDAHLAALAMEHGLVLQSTDGDFGRFHGLKWENPIV
ncbi:MAG: type II toxin-antitoxin system VapC family toxin [Deltaproteobacteria bacterium]|nr:type II toxin-antitoxin system VapC family toxin [Deltaproteobacteria bacterium]